MPGEVVIEDDDERGFRGENKLPDAQWVRGLEEEVRKVKIQRRAMFGGQKKELKPTRPFAACRWVVVAAIVLWVLSLCIVPGLPCPFPGKSTDYARRGSHNLVAVQVLYGAGSPGEVEAGLEKAVVKRKEQQQQEEEEEEEEDGLGECAWEEVTACDAGMDEEGVVMWKKQVKLATAGAVGSWVLLALCLAWMMCVAASCVPPFAPFLFAGIAFCAAAVIASLFSFYVTSEAFDRPAESQPYPANVAFWIRCVSLSAALLIVAQLPPHSVSPPLSVDPGFLTLEHHPSILSLPLVLLLPVFFYPPSDNIALPLLFELSLAICLPAVYTLSTEFSFVYRAPMSKEEATETFLS